MRLYIAEDVERDGVGLYFYCDEDAYRGGEARRGGRKIKGVGALQEIARTHSRHGAITYVRLRFIRIVKSDGGWPDDDAVAVVIALPIEGGGKITKRVRVKEM